MKHLLEFFIFLLYPWKFQTKQSSTLGCSTKLCSIPWKFQGQKQRPIEISHYLFWVTLGNFTSFFINPRNYTCYFFDMPGNSISSTPPSPSCLDFFSNSPFHFLSSIFRNLTINWGKICFPFGSMEF